MKSLLLMLTALVISANATAGGNVTNIERPDNLQVTNILKCIDLDLVQNIYTPADLFSASVDCANTYKDEKAARLFLFARVYGSYDMNRVEDNTAHQSIMVLIQQSFSAMRRNADFIELEINDNLIGNPDNLKSFCSSVKNVGKPNYYPAYMISHGMSAMTGTSDGLIEGFDGDQTWLKTLSGCE
jgi:hypothetical protein